MAGRNGNVGVMLRRDVPREQVIDFARRAEELGFDELWVVEDLGFRGGVAQAAAVLASTSRIRVGIGLLPAGARNAAFAAMEIATLAELFPGRIDVSIGHGMPDWMRAVGTWPASPLTLLDEYITTVRGLLRGERIETRGRARYVGLDGVELEASATPAIVPGILAGVRGPKSLALGGSVADGTVLAEPAGPEYVRAALAHIAPTRPHALVVYNVASVHEDATVAIDAVRPGLAWMGEPDWAVHIDPLPFAAEFAALRARSTREEFVERLPAEWVARLAIAGTAADARARNDELFAAGVTTSVLTPVGDDQLAALDALAAVL